MACLNRRDDNGERPMVVGAEHWKVYPGKEDYARLIEETARRLGHIKHGDAHLRGFNTHVFGKPQTLENSISTDSYPTLETLSVLSRRSGVPLDDWLVALRLMPPRSRHDLPSSIALRRLIAVAQGLPDDTLDSVTDILRRLRG